MPDSGSREPGFESPTCDGTVDADTLWRQQNKILVIDLYLAINRDFCKYRMGDAVVFEADLHTVLRLGILVS